MNQMDDRAEQLLLRLKDTGLDDKISQADLLGSFPGPDHRSLCLRLVLAVQGAADSAGIDCGPSLLSAVNAVTRTCADQHPKMDRLASGIKRVAASLGSSRVGTAIEAMEVLVGFLQAAKILAIEKDTTVPMQVEEPSFGDADRIIAEPTPRQMEISGLVCSTAGLMEVDANSPCGAEVLQAADQKLQRVAAALPAGLLSQAVPPGLFSDQEVEALRKVDELLRCEYEIRRKMLLERTKVTLQSFLWSTRLATRGTEAEAKELVEQLLQEMSPDPAVSLQQVFSARYGDLISIAQSKTSQDRSLGTSIKGMLMGRVPDRGGRTEDGTESRSGMPSFQPRKRGGGNFKRGRGRKEGSGKDGGGRKSDGHGHGRGRGRGGGWGNRDG